MSAPSFAQRRKCIVDEGRRDLAVQRLKSIHAVIGGHSVVW
ncbi:MAG: hypothetical protein AAFQ58_02410 [Pseudomonadota bacterium]